MRTRSSFNLPVVSPSNPSTLNLKRRNRRHSKQPFILEESLIDTMADQRTMAELLRAPTEGYAEAIVVPPILAEQFELKHSLINMMTSDQTTNLRNEISNFQQRFDDSFHEAWDRYKDLLCACPRHGFTELHQIDTFYNALNPADQDSLNAAVGGNLLERRSQDVLMIIENKSKIAKLTYAVNQQTSAVTTAMMAILKQFQATPPPAFVKDVKEICVTCGGAHCITRVLSELKCKALANLGARINLMPLSVWKKLEVKDDIFDPEGGNVLPEKLLDLNSTKDLHPPLCVNQLSGSTTYSSSPNQLLEEFTDELALIIFPLEYDDDLQFDIESNFKEIEYLLYHDPIKDLDSSLKDLIDHSNLADLDNNLVDSMPEMFTDKHALDYSSPLIFDEYDDDLLEVVSDTKNVYDDPFDSKGENTKESKLLIDELDLPCDSFFSSEYDSFVSKDFSMVNVKPSTNNEDKVFNPCILIQENLFEIITRVVQDKKMAISNASLMLEDFNPPLYELPFFKEVPSIPGNLKTHAKGFYPPVFISSASLGIMRITFNTHLTFTFKAKQDMDQQYPTVAKIHVLDIGKFEQWQFRMQQYLQHEHYALWEVIEFGDSYEVPANDPSTTTTNTNTTSGEAGTKSGRTITLTTEDIQKKKNDVKARTTLLLSLPDEHQLRFKVQKKTEPNTQNMAFISLAKHSRGNDEVNTASVYTTSSNVPTASIGKKISIQGSDVAGFNKLKVECFNCHKMGHFAREGRAPRNQDRGRRDNYRQGSKAEEQAPKALMAIDEDWSYMANDEEDHALVADEKAPTEFALMANTSTESKVIDNSLCSKDCKKNNDSLNSKITDLTDKLFNAKNMIYHYKLALAQVGSRLVEYKEREVKYIEKIRTLEYYLESKKECYETLKKELETLKQEKEVVNGKLAGLLTASKDIDNLIESQRSDTSKEGLGYTVVPLPPAQLYLSSKKDLSRTGLPECTDDTVTNYSRPSPIVESSSEEDQNRNPSVSKNVASPITPKPFVKFVKASNSQSKSKTDKKETPKKPPVIYAEQYRKPNKKPNVRGNQRN
nr:reverse transcriptase domain-containing protein [Tanacetum cinerariifolium]